MVAVQVLGVGGLAEGHLANMSLIPLFFRGHQGCYKVSHTGFWHRSTQIIIPIHCPHMQLGSFTLYARPWLSMFFPPHLLPFLCSDLAIDVPGHGKVVVDISYGGTFYAFLSAEQLGLDVCSSKTRDLVSAASAVTEAVKKQV